MDDIFIALGSNLGDRRGQMIKALKALQQYGVVQRVSPLYQTGAYGLTGQPDFYNAVVQFFSPLAPLPLLRQLKQIEQDLGRRQRMRWGPREIDLDIIFYGEQQVEMPELTIPHPDFRNRRFVLQPLSDIAPAFLDPQSGKSVRELLKMCSDNTRVIFIAEDWYLDELEI
jgi:2-amino-4-hydroxy-6-hydroxymethyldihydropteridine diphosphokinase